MNARYVCLLLYYFSLFYTFHTYSKCVYTKGEWINQFMYISLSIHTYMYTCTPLLPEILPPWIFSAQNAMENFGEHAQKILHTILFFFFNFVKYSNAGNWFFTSSWGNNFLSSLLFYFYIQIFTMNQVDCQSE